MINLKSGARISKRIEGLLSIVFFLLLCCVRLLTLRQPLQNVNYKARCHLRKKSSERKMESSSLDRECPASPLSIPNCNPSFSFTKKKSRVNKKKSAKSRIMEGEVLREAETDWVWPSKGRSGGSVMLEGYVEVGDGGEKGSEGGGEVVGRTKSLTDEDLEDLKGCLDLGFGFNYEEIPELCNTLPALELCYSMSQKFLDEQQRHSLDGDVEVGCGSAAPSAPIANWKISSPGDNPDEVKARLKYWAQAVACTVRLCN
ncbi:hypothetical protein M5K25_022606 [Dendrobium thyrsiflorum]|uniref:Uncharacterized protein n=1 Tax=Dendrobium thyrsiflorum TaxID=117978 RepID=A0ABD0U6I1_DENTH